MAVYHWKKVSLAVQLFQRKAGSLPGKEWKVDLQVEVEELVRQARPSGPLFLFSSVMIHSIKNSTECTINKKVKSTRCK